MPAASDIIQYFRGQLFETPILPHTSFSGKTVVITGSNTGLGFESAKHLVQLNVSTLILAVRNISKGEDAKARLEPEREKKGTEILVWQLDMASYASVQAFAKRLEELPRLDALVANAGISLNEFRLAEGLESTLTVNVVSTFLLVLLALPVLEKSAKSTGVDGHVTITGSVVQAFANPKELETGKQGSIFEKLTVDGQKTMGGRYFLSKLILQLAFQELAERSEKVRNGGKGGKVIINSPSPGWCKTELFRQDDGGFWGRNLLKLIGRTPEMGARTIISAVAAGGETHGQYLSECKVKRASAFARSQEGMLMQARVWEEVAEILEGVRPGVTEILA